MINLKSNILINKLDEFIKKYYFNKIIKGIILSLAIIGLVYLIVVTLEYFGRFSVTNRTLLFYTGFISLIAVLTIMIIIPLLKLFKIGKCISYKRASQILGEHFSEISDKLQNTLELSEISNENPESKDLIIASINQRTEQLSPLPFLSAIKLKENIKYLRYLFPVVVVIAVIFLLWPFVITEGTERIINYRTYYETPAPFKFQLLNDSLSVRRGGDFKIKVKTSGRYIPNRVLLNYRGNGFYMEQETPGVFTYNLRNLNNDIDFYFSALEINSKEYNLKVLPAPIIIDFNVNINPPAYTNIEKSTVRNAGDISVPIGSRVQWGFNTANINKLSIVFDTVEIVAEKEKSRFSFDKQILKSGNYSIHTENQHFKEQTGITYRINVIPDLYPSISVEEITDSANTTIYYFNGMIDDDYGFNSLTFNYIPGEKSDTTKKINIPFSKNMSTQSFFFAFDFSEVEIEGRQIRYYFEVGDNDAINGSKKSRTEIREYIIPSLRDMEAESERAMESIDSKVSEAMKISDEIKRDIDNLQKDIIDKQLSDWERNQAIQQIIDKQKQLESLVQNVSEEQKSLSQQKEQWSKDEELLKKHQQIQELLENLIDDEMRKLLEELQELAENFDMSKFQDLMEEMKRSSDDIEAQMERTLELLKRMEIEERLKNTVSKLEELAREHEKLSEETKDESSSRDDIMQKQEEHKEEFEQISEDYEKTLEKNQELKKPYKLDEFSDDFQQIMEKLDKTSGQLSQDDNQGASDSQKSNAKEMQDLSDKLQEMMDQQMQQQATENMQDLRQILDNLLIFSFEQEEIMVNQKGLSVRDPRYRNFMLRQKQIQDNFSVIRDSLNTLGQRVPELGPTINKERAGIYRNLDGIIEDMADNRQNRVQTSQQLVMTSANNLALLLSEVLEQMQEQMAMQMGGNGGNCNMSQSEGEGEMGRMRSIQEGLKQQLQDMIDQMKDGGMQPGAEQSEQLARMLKQQEMMQKMLNDMMTGGISPETARILNEINRLIEENISNLINKNITPEMLMRKEEILTRLLEAEKSEREREIDDKRESNEARDYKLSNPDKAFKDKEREFRFNELLQISNIKLNSFYQNRYKEYLKQLEE